MQTEWESAFYAYREAQARIANSAAFLALQWWLEQVGPMREPTPMFISELTGVVSGARRLSRRLAHAYYQYHRALETGGFLGDHQAGAQTLHEARDAYWDLLNDASLLGTGKSGDEDEVYRWFEDQMRNSDWSQDDDNPRRDKLNREEMDRALQRFLDNWDSEDRSVGREGYQWPTDTDFDRLQREIDRRVREIAREATRTQRRRLTVREELEERRSTEDEEDEAHQNVGQRVAGEIVSLVSDAADQTTRHAVDRDRLVMAVSRGTSGNPCAFCAMLASRGPVYRNVDAAGFGSGFSKAHRNCQCYPIVHFTRVNINNPDEWPTRNRELREIWDSVREQNTYAPRKKMLSLFRQRLRARGMGQ